MKRPRSPLAFLTLGVWIVAVGMAFHRVQPYLSRPPQRQWQNRYDWRPATKEERRAAIQTIQAQLQAFKKDDYKKAAIYQSEDLRVNCGAIPDFQHMMRVTYPEFLEYESVEYGSARCNTEGNRMRVRLVLTGEDGVTTRAAYRMVKEKGAYKVDGVRKW